MESILTELRNVATVIDQIKDESVDLGESDMTAALTAQLDYAAASIRLAIGIAHRSERQRRVKNSPSCNCCGTTPESTVVIEGFAGDCDTEKRNQEAEAKRFWRI